MTHIRKFNETVNEGVRDKMTPKSTDDIKKVIEKLPPYKALSTAYRYELPELIKIGWDRVKPINDKLYQDVKKFNKKNIDKFMDFITTWIDEQGGESYGMQQDFENISYKLGVRIEEEYDDEDEENEEPVSEKVIESIYSENTIELYKQLVISYTIDSLSHGVFEQEEEEDDWEEEEVGGGLMQRLEQDERDEEDEDAYYDRLTSKMEEELKKEKEEEALKKKKEEEKKPINKIKKFLGFDKDDE